jgi:hypothetical protein
MARIDTSISFPPIGDEVMPLDRAYVRSVRKSLEAVGKAGGTHAMLATQSAHLMDRMERDLEAAFLMIESLENEVAKPKAESNG